jgi:hypothetical protein
MKDRCCNPRKRGYNRYGGRGITVCTHWIDSFPTFYEDMGPCPPGWSLDRIDNDGPYQCWRHGTPQNCRWATVSQQTANRSHSVRIPDEVIREIRSRYPSIRFKQFAARQLAHELGISYQSLYLIATRRRRRDVL